MDSRLTEATPALQGVLSGYGRPGEPLLGYGALAGVYALIFSALLAAAHRRGALRNKITPQDIALIGVATFRLSRLVTKDKVTSGFRAPFVKFEKATGAGEVEEDARGTGLQRAVGDLVTCPYCIGLWVSTCLTFGMLFAAQSTRVLSSIVASVALSDALNHSYLKLKDGP